MCQIQTGPRGQPGCGIEGGKEGRDFTSPHSAATFLPAPLLPPLSLPVHPTGLCATHPAKTPEQTPTTSLPAASRRCEWCKNSTTLYSKHRIILAVLASFSLGKTSGLCRFALLFFYVRGNQTLPLFPTHFETSGCSHSSSPPRTNLFLAALLLSSSPPLPAPSRLGNEIRTA